MNAQPRVLVSRATQYTDCNCACADGEDQAEPDSPLDAELQWIAAQDYVWELLDDGHVVCISPSGKGAVAV